MDCGSPFGHCACPKEIPLGDVFVRLRRTKNTLSFFDRLSAGKRRRSCSSLEEPCGIMGHGADFPPFSSRYPTKLYPYVKNV